MDSIFESMLCALHLGDSMSSAGSHACRAETSVQKPHTETARVFQIIETKGWLPGMDSNHKLDKFLKSHNLLILQSR